MLSRRGHRLSRFRKNKRRLRERLRRRIFSEIKWCRKQWKNQRVLVLTGQGFLRNQVFVPFAPQMACGKNIGLKMWQRRKVSIAILNWCKRFITPVVGSCSSQKFSLTPPHLALAKLPERPRRSLLLVTQNIDNLHERAGNTNVIHMHGNC